MLYVAICYVSIRPVVMRVKEELQLFIIKRFQAFIKIHGLIKQKYKINNSQHYGTCKSHNSETHNFKLNPTSPSTLTVKKQGRTDIIFAFCFYFMNFLHSTIFVT